MQLQCTQLGNECTVTACRISLTLEWLQLATHFAQKILRAQQVRLGAFETTLGLLLALAVLEYARCFLDDRATILGTRVEHCIDLTLADDDVLLATHTGVGEQILHVEQPARHTVDRVLALTTAKQRAADGDLAELERQEPGAVVDGEDDLGAAERRTLRSAGKDDVVHLLAAHRRGGLRAEHPCNGIDDVALARPVRTDDDGDPRLELHHRGVGKGLEALHGERLEEHPGKE